MTIADLEQFTVKSKPIIYTKVFIKLYNGKNRGQIHEIYRIVKLKKLYILTAKNTCNFSAHCIIKTSSILHNI